MGSLARSVENDGVINPLFNWFPNSKKRKSCCCLEDGKDYDDLQDLYNQVLGQDQKIVYKELPKNDPLQRKPRCIWVNKSIFKLIEQGLISYGLLVKTNRHAAPDG